MSRVIASLKGKIDLNKIIIRNLSPTKIVLMIENIEIFRNALTILKECKFDFYTRTPKTERIYSWILKRIADDFEENDILEELEQLSLENVKILKVRKINLSNFLSSQKRRLRVFSPNNKL